MQTRYHIGDLCRFMADDGICTGYPSQLCRISAVVTEPDSDHDLASLPTYRVTFRDSVSVEAWEDELESTGW
jgi:hypothetical protein